jgi:hypothetical protein
MAEAGTRGAVAALSQRERAQSGTGNHGCTLALATGFESGSLIGSGLVACGHLLPLNGLAQLVATWLLLDSHR